MILLLVNLGRSCALNSDVWYEGRSDVTGPLGNCEFASDKLLHSSRSAQDVLAGTFASMIDESYLSNTLAN